MGNFFRWLLFVPASVIAGLLAYIAFNMTWSLLILGDGILGDGILSSLRVLIKTIIDFMASGLMGTVFAWMVYQIVPSNKKMTTYISSAVAGFIVTLSAGIGIAQGIFTTPLMAVGVLIGLGVVCLLSEEDIKA